MAEEITHNVAAQWGAIGILVAVLLGACIALWRRLVKIQDDYFEQTVQHTAVLVELNVLIRNRPQ